MDKGSTQLRHSSPADKLGQFVHRLFRQAFAWIVPTAIMYATCKALIPYEIGHPLLTRLAGAAIWIPCYFLGRWLEKSWMVKSRSNERRLGENLYPKGIRQFSNIKPRRIYQWQRNYLRLPW